MDVPGRSKQRARRRLGRAGFAFGPHGAMDGGDQRAARDGFGQRDFIVAHRGDGLAIDEKVLGLSVGA